MYRIPAYTMLMCAFFGVGGVVRVDHGLRTMYGYCVITWNFPSLSSDHSVGITPNVASWIARLEVFAEPGKPNPTQLNPISPLQVLPEVGRAPKLRWK
jgi:hypothetical protein